jgi:pimeloyl-ACP methyl ester carboxylesterase
VNVREQIIAIRGKHICLLRGGTGPPLLYLHDTYCYTWTSVHDRLAEHCDVVFPIHPGCAGSTGFEDIDDMEGLVFHYLDVCEALHLERPVLLGASLGGWIAAELAVRYAAMLRGMILVDALGLRVPKAPAADILRLDAPQARAAPGKPSRRVCPVGQARRPWRWLPPAPHPRAAAQRYRRAQPTASAESAPSRRGPVRSSSLSVQPGPLLDRGPSPHADSPGVYEGRCTTSKRHGLVGPFPGPRVGCGRWPRCPRARLEPGWPSPLRFPDAAPGDGWSGRGAHAVRRAGARGSPAQRVCPRHEDVCGDGDRDDPQTTPETGPHCQLGAQGD